MWQQALNQLINIKSELPAFLIKPVQRICKYPLLLDVSDFGCYVPANAPTNIRHLLHSRLSRRHRLQNTRTTMNSRLALWLPSASRTKSTRRNVVLRIFKLSGNLRVALKIGKVTIWPTLAIFSWTMSSWSLNPRWTGNTTSSSSRRSSCVARKHYPPRRTVGKRSARAILY